MKNTNLTELVFILDRSGSMNRLENDTIGGYNSFIEKQKKEAGDAVVTTVLFDDEYEIIHDNADINKIRPLTNKEYYARGMTALMDAVGKTINHVGNRHKYAVDAALPGKTMVIIITDGYENASREFTAEQIKSMITHQKERYGWEFLFMGANIDAVSTASEYGISEDRAVTYEADSEGTVMNFEAASVAASCVRANAPLTREWKSRIENRKA